MRSTPATFADSAGGMTRRASARLIHESLAFDVWRTAQVDDLRRCLHVAVAQVWSTRNCAERHHEHYECSAHVCSPPRGAPTCDAVRARSSNVSVSYAQNFFVKWSVLARSCEQYG